MGKKRKRPIQLMYSKYGEHSEGVVCSKCCNCTMNINGGKRIYKCLAYGVTADKSTDWHPGNTACGYFNMPFDELTQIPMLGLVGLRPQARMQISNNLKRKITWAEYKLKKICTDQDKAYFEKIKSESKAKLAELEALEYTEKQNVKEK